MSVRSPSPALPPVDERLVEPDTSYEIIEGTRYYVAPADEPHGAAHSKLAALLEAHRADGFAVAVEMLTRTSLDSDFAPDASVYPAARDPATGRRQLEHLAFEILSTQRRANAARKARILTERGVRRVFAIDVQRPRVFEWARAAARWELLDPEGHITDVTLAVPLAVAALVDAVAADAAIARALRLKRHPEFEAAHEQGREAGRAEGRAEALAGALLIVLEGRGLAPTAAERERIRAERDPARLERWLAAAATCQTIATLLAD